jgi:hypothetical protein
LIAPRAAVAAPVPRPETPISYPLLARVVKRVLVTGGAVVLFGSGIFAGHFATTTWPGPVNWYDPGKPLAGVVLDKLKWQLRLTPAQTAQIAPIVNDACANLRMVSEESRAGRLALLDEVGASIEPDLSAGQEERLEDLQAEWQNRPTIKRDVRIVALY